MRKFFFIVVFLVTIGICHAQNFLDPFFKAQLDLFYLRQISNAVKNINIADGSITTNKLASPFNLPANQIENTALTQITIFGGPNISGVFSNLIITGFYLDSNPSNFVDAVFVLGQGFITGADVPTFETDPTVTGLSVTQTWLSATGAVPNAVTNVQIFLDGKLQSWSTNGVALP